MKMASAIFLLAAKFMCVLGAIKAEQNTSSTRRNIQQLEPQNIREPILDFTPHFGEINPDMLYLCRRGQSVLKRAVFAFFPSVRRESMKKSLNRRFFAKKQVNFWDSYLLSRKPLIVNRNLIVHRKQMRRLPWQNCINHFLIYICQKYPWITYS